jgi:UDP-N-acetylmuramate dehydrogenase
MSASHLDKIEGIEKGRLLAKLSTFGLGGPADYFFDLKDTALLPALIAACKADKLPYLILGWGSNLIFSEKGFRGLVIRLGGKKMAMDGDLLVVEAGALLSQVIQFGLKNGLVGMEKLMGIPGTIGGAIRGNAGAYGVEVKDFFEKALVFKDDFVEMKKDQMLFGYRNSGVKRDGGVILKIWLKLKHGDVAKATAEMREIVASRAGKHPQGFSCGSFFKNPSGNSVGTGLVAAIMVDQAGFKGKHIGGVYISELHSNFLMNDGSATQADVISLYTQIQDAVEKKFGVRLQKEVQLVGETGLIS